MPRDDQKGRYSGGEFIHVDINVSRRPIFIISILRPAGTLAQGSGNLLPLFDRLKSLQNRELRLIASTLIRLLIDGQSRAPTQAWDRYTLYYVMKLLDILCSRRKHSAEPQRKHPLACEETEQATIAYRFR